MLDPQITRAQLVQDKLYVVGALASEPVPITFEMLFQPVDGLWRIYGLSITPVSALMGEGPASPVRSALVRPEPSKPPTLHHRKRTVPSQATPN